MIISLLLIMPAIVHGQNRTATPIDWTAANEVRQQASTSSSVAAVRASVPASSQLDDIELPVLLLPQAAERSTPRIRHQTSSYAAAYSLRGAKLSIVGTNSAISVPNESIAFHTAELGNASAPMFERTEDGADLSFNRYGASYTLRLSCAEPTDSRCTKEVFLKDIADQMIPVGGKGQ